MVLLLRVFLSIILCIAGNRATDCNQKYKTITILEEQTQADYYYKRRPTPKTKVLEVYTTCIAIEFPLREIYESEMDSPVGSCNDCVEELTISKSNVSLVPMLAFKNFPRTTKLDMQSNGIQTILPGAFNNFNTLKELNLSGNNMTELHNGIFNSLDKLEKLDLSNNKIHTVGLYSFAGSAELQYLNLSANNLKLFNWSTMTYLKSIKNIDLSFNGLLKFDFQQLPNEISVLDLSHNMIAKVHGCISHIEEINLGNNRLSSMAQQINTSCSSNSLKKLDISSNSIFELNPQFFTNLTNLVYLNCENNSISTIEIDLFSNMYSLQYLDLSYNNLKGFQYGLFENLIMLKDLDLSHNRITELIKRNFHSLKTLEKLDIAYNRITAIDAEQLLSDLPTLKEIVIENNNITCDNLIAIIHKFQAKGVLVHKGAHRNISNVHGIACWDNGNGNFSKYLDNSSNTYKDFLNKSDFFKYFDEGFKRSNFYKYLEDFKVNTSPSNIVNNEFMKSFMYNYSNNDVLYQQNVKHFWNTKPIGGNNSQVEKLPIYTENVQNYNTGLLIIITFLLLILVFILTLQTYKFREIVVHKKEQVELLSV